MNAVKELLDDHVSPSEEDLEHAFVVADVDHSGGIDRDEVRRLLL